MGRDKGNMAEGQPENWGLQGEETLPGGGWGTRVLTRHLEKYPRCEWHVIG